MHLVRTVRFCLISSLLLLLALFIAREFTGSPTPHASPATVATPARPLPDNFVRGELLVKFRDSISIAAQGSLLAAKGLAVKNEIPPLRVKVVSVPIGSERETAKILSQCPEIEFAEQDVLGESCLTPNDPWYSYQWQLPKISAPAGWDISTGSTTVPIAILDTGFDPSNADIGSKLLSGYNSATGTSDTSYTGNGHGTVVASLAAGRGNDGFGTAGVAWKNPILPVKIFDSSGSLTLAYAASGITWAANNGARVINMSWIFYWSAPPQTLIDAVNYAASKGVVLVAAAGNDNTTYLQGIYPPYPQTLSNVLTVAATDSNDQRCTYSNFGSYVGIAAPSGISVSNSTGAVYATGPGGALNWATGTSMSAPQVAGLAGLVLSVNPSLSNSQVISLIENNADDLGAPGWDQYYGYGRINVYKTLAAAKSLSVPAITSPLTVSGAVGAPFQYTITATNSPGSFNATPLPAGLSVNTSNGQISGTPTASGTTNVTISATNASGTGTATLALTISANVAPTITSAATAAPNPASAGQNVAFTVSAGDADGDALTYSWTFGDGASASGSSTTHTYAAAGSFTATATVKDIVGNSVASSVTVTVNAASAVRVAGIAMKLNNSTGNSGKSATATVTIVNASGGAVGGATVTGNWSGLVSSTVSGVTASNGTVALLSPKSKQTGTFTFTVTGISAAGYVYDSSKNTVTRASITTGGVVTLSAIAGESMTAAPDTISLGTVALNQRFKMSLPLPANISTGANVKTNATGLPMGIKVGGSFIGGKPKQAGNFTFTIQFKTAQATASQQYTITVNR